MPSTVNHSGLSFRKYRKPLKISDHGLGEKGFRDRGSGTFEMPKLVAHPVNATSVSNQPISQVRSLQTASNSPPIQVPTMIARFVLI